jgi:hypothetical protein
VKQGDSYWESEKPFEETESVSEKRETGVFLYQMESPLH